MLGCALSFFTPALAQGLTEPLGILPFQHLAPPVTVLQLNQHLMVRTNWAQSGHALGHRQEKCQPHLREPKVNGLGIRLHLLAWASQEPRWHLPLPDDSLRQGWDSWKTAPWTSLKVSVSACLPPSPPPSLLNTQHSLFGNFHASPVAWLTSPLPH